MFIKTWLAESVELIVAWVAVKIGYNMDTADTYH